MDPLSDTAGELAPLERRVLDHLRDVIGVGTSIDRGSLACALGIASGSLTRALNSLEAKGQVRSRRSTHRAFNNGRPVWTAVEA
jgi:DNA-binding MarR family transcriptional regulator